MSKCRLDTDDDDLTGMIDEHDAEFLDEESDSDVCGCDAQNDDSGTTVGQVE
jgi:hypothetical protein